MSDSENMSKIDGELLKERCVFDNVGPIVGTLAILDKRINPNHNLYDVVAKGRNCPEPKIQSDLPNTNKVNSSQIQK